MALFPNVPIAPGVPPLLRSPGFVSAVVAMIEGDALAIVSLLLRQQWGLYLNGLPAIVSDSVRALDLRHDFDISDYPQERGAFASYNKVQRPFQGRLRFMSGGSEDDRRAMLESIIIAQESLELYDLVMPEMVYVGVNITHYDFRRTAENGNGLLAVDVMCEQVRETATAEFTQTQSPSGTNQINGGPVQSQALTASQQSSFSGLGAIY